MSLKLKHLLPIFALALGIGLALLIPRVKAFAIDVNEGETLVEGNSTNFRYRTSKIDTYATITFIDQYENGGVYYSTFGTTTDILFNVCVSPNENLRATYLNGRAILGITMGVTVDAPTQFSLSDLVYNISLVNCSDDNVHVAFMINGANKYQLYMYFDDYAFFYSTTYINVTLALRLNGRASWSGSAPHVERSLPLHISPSFGNFNDGVVGSSVSFEELRIRDAIDASVDTQGILDQLISANAHMVWSDGTAVYDVADLLWMINGSQMTANSTLQSQYNQDTATQGLVNQILTALTTDSSGVSSATNTQVSQAHQREATAQQAFDNILGDMENGQFSGYSSGLTFQSGLDSLALGKTSTHRLVADNAIAIDFWKRVGDELLSRNAFGSIAAFLMVVLIIGFTAWVLKL